MMKKQLEKTTINDLKQLKTINLSSIYGGSVGTNSQANQNVGSVKKSDI